MNEFYIMNLIIAAIISLVLGPIIIPELKKLKIGQSIRADGPESHLKKSGTPTMGGIIFMLSTIITLVVFGFKDSRVYICVFSMIGFGVVGFIDDYLIVVKKTNDGLTPRQKFSAQILVALLVIFLSSKLTNDHSLFIPFWGKNLIDVGIFYYPLTLFVVLGTVNSVNLTDGLDGLASSVSVVALIGFTIVNIIFGNRDISMFAMTVAGAILGFLQFNKYPAKVFMGDVGSLALGGVFAAIAVSTGTTLYLPIIGFVFVMETLSVIIQVLSFKLRGKRVFLMSPIHHHFEAKGWSEIRIVRIFYFITTVLTLIAIVGILGV